jgi:hypothetical protein
MTTAATNGLAVGTYTLNTGSIAIAGSSTGGRYSTLSISTGTLNVTGNISYSGTAAQARIVCSGGATINVGGNFLPGAFTASSSTVNLNGAGAQSLGAFTYNALNINGTSSTTTAAGNITCASLTVDLNNSFNINARIISVTGNWTNDGTITGTTGRLNGTTGTFTNNGAINLSTGRIIQTTGSLTNSASGTITFSGAGTITFGTGNFINLHTSADVNFGSSAISLTGAAANQTIGGFVTTGLVSMTKTSGTVTFTGNVNGGAFTLNGSGGTLDLGNGLVHTFSGTFTRTAGTIDLNSSELHINGTTSGTGGTWTSGTSTVDYGGAAQTVFAVTYNDLTLSGSGIKTLSGVSTINGNFVMSGSAQATLTTALNVTGSTTLSGTSILTLGTNNILSTSLIILDGGTFRTGSTTGYNETIGTLNLMDNSTIMLGTSARSLTFADSHLEAWISGKTLTITGWTGTAGASGTAGKIYVGVGGLSTEQLAQISFTGYTGIPIILGTGELVPPDPGSLSSDYFRSKATGDWNSISTWESSHDGSTNWINATLTPTSAATLITIQSGHTVSVSASLAIDQTVIDNGGTLTVNAGQILTLNNGVATDLAVNGTCSVNGTLINTGTITIAGTVSVNSGGTYEHAQNGGTIPSATWDSNSSCLVTGITTTLPSGLNQTFGNFTWDCAGQGGNDLDLYTNGLPTINGDFSVVDTGSSGSIRLTRNSDLSLIVGGSFIQTGGIVNLSWGSGVLTMDIAGNILVSGSSTLLFGTGNVASSYSGIINLSGNISVGAGSILDCPGYDSGQIVYNKTGIQTFSNQGSFSWVDHLINASSELLLLTDLPLYSNFGFGDNLTVDGTIDLGTNIVIGTGPDSFNTFNLNTGGTLKTGNVNGITSSGASGSIQVGGTRTYSSTANYIYDGASAQVTGNGLPSTVSNLTISNAAGVTLDAAKTITNNLSITSGSKVNLGALTHSAGTLTLGGSLTVAGSWGSTSSAATNKDDTYFALSTGIVNVTSGVCVTVGNPADFGNNTWNVYAYNGGSIDFSGTTYRGYYTVAGLNFDTRNSWTNDMASPSSASGYQGCPVNTDYMTFVHKRQGFPCGTYQISVGHDDDARLYVNGGNVWEQTGWNSSPVLVWTGFLDETSTVEFRVQDGNGASYGQLVFAFTAAVTATPVISSPICSGATLVSGTSTEADGTTIEIFKGGVSQGTTTVSGGTWTKSGLTALVDGDVITATAIATNKCVSSISASVTVNATPSAPTTTGGLICIGSTATLTASGGVSGDQYRWYDAATSGNILQTSTSTTYTTPVLGSTTNYWVSILNTGGCEGTRTQVTATFPSISADNQNASGTDSWIGHTYDGTNFNTYFGSYVENETFDQSFGGSTTCFNITSNSITRSIYTESFSVKYKMTSSRRGLYVVDLGSDDKSRLTVDGYLIFDNWIDQAWTSRPRVLVNFTGSSSLLYEYTENGGQNRVVFQNLTQVLANNLSTNTSQTICMGSIGSEISGDAFGTLPTGITLSGTGYQWAYSTASASGPWTDISGATSATYTPSASSAPFNAAGTYYLMRKAILLSASNNTGVSNYLATNVSNAATLVVNTSVAASVSIGATATTICGGTSVTFTATPTNGGTTPTYQWKLNGSDVGTGGTTYTSSALTNSDQVRCVMTSNVTPCVTGNPATSNIITMNVSAEPTIANAGPDQTDGSTCGLTSVVLAANSPTVGTGAWSIVSGVGGSFGNAASPGSSFSGNPGSTYTLRWTISNLPCASSSDETTVTFNIIPTITGTSPVERCGAGSVTLGATASAGVIDWYINPTGGSSLGTGTSFATPVISNSTTYYVDATSNGCTTSSRTAVLATVHVLPTITVSPDVAICSGSNTTLTAGGGSSYVWSPSSGLSSSSGTSVTASPTATTTYTVTGTDSNGCSNTATTTVTVNELPTFSSVAANCAPDLLSYSVLVTVSSGSLTSTEGTVVNTSGNDWTVSSIPTGTNTTLTVTDANSCLNTSVVTAPDCSCPTINAPVSGGNHQYCTGSSVPEISASVASGETVDWYSVSSGGTSLSTGLTYTPSSAGTYYAEARNTTSNCKSSTRTAVTITENPNASISLTSASGTDGQTVCINSPIDNITYLVGGGGTNAGVTGLPSGLSGNFNAGVFTISGSPTASGTFNYTVTTTGTCSQTSANGTVTVDQATVGGTISGGASSICLGTSTGTLTLSGYTGTIVRWERQINSGGWNSVGSGGSSTFSETPYSSGTWEYRVVVQNGVCAPEYSSVFSLNIDPTTAAGWITSSSFDPICEGASTPTLTLNGSTGSILRWEKQLNLGAWQNIANTNTTFSEVPSSGGTWGYRALVQSGTCPSAYQTPFTVVVNPTLTITLGSDPEICEGTTIANIPYTATTGNPASYSIDFDPAANAAGFTDFSGWGFSASPLSVNVPWNAAPGDYYGSLTIGTNYPVCASQVYPVHIKVNPNLPVSVSIAADANPICAGINVTFTATPANGGASPSYQWKKNGGNVGSNSSTYTDATLANDDQIACVLTSNATCATGSPATSNTVTMTVNPNLPVSVSIGASANPICAGTSVTFTATPTNGGLNPTYQWKKNGGNVGSNSTSYTDAALVNGDLITCELTSDAICATGSPATSNTVTMTVNSFSVAPTGISGTTTICAGGSTTLTLSGGTAGTGAIAEWFTGSCGGSSAGTGNSITVSPASSTTYYVRYNGTCNTTTCASVFVTVNSLSVAPTGISGTTTICAGGSTTLTLSGGTPGTGGTAEWFTGSCGGTSAGTGNSITVSPASSTTYYVRYNGTCNTTSCASVLVTVFSPSVAPTGISGTTTICAGGSTTLTLSGGTAGTGAIAEWFTGSCGGTSAGTGNSITVSPASSTTYYVRYNGTCNTTSCASVFVTVNSPSVAPTGITGTTTICAGSSTTLTLSGGTPGTGATVEWFTGSCGGTSTGTGNSITVSPAGSTTYYVRYNGTCNTTTCASVLVTVNLNPTVSAGIAVAAICQGSTSAPLVGSFGGGATSAVWSDGGAGGSFTNNSGSTPGTATYTASITSSSSVTLTLTTIGGSCGTTSDSKQITVNPIPTPGGFTTD